MCKLLLVIHWNEVILRAQIDRAMILVEYQHSEWYAPASVFVDSLRIWNWKFQRWKWFTTSSKIRRQRQEEVSKKSLWQWIPDSAFENWSSFKSSWLKIGSILCWKTFVWLWCHFLASLATSQQGCSTSNQWLSTWNSSAVIICVVSLRRYFSFLNHFEMKSNIPGFDDVVFVLKDPKFHIRQSIRILLITLALFDAIFLLVFLTQFGVISILDSTDYRKLWAPYALPFLQESQKKIRRFCSKFQTEIFVADHADRINLDDGGGQRGEVFHRVQKLSTLKHVQAHHPGLHCPNHRILHLVQHHQVKTLCHSLKSNYLQEQQSHLTE